MMSQNIVFKMFKNFRKLRVRIVTPGYKNEANCQFPRAIRAEGLKYLSTFQI